MPHEKLAIDFNLDIAEQKQAWEVIVQARRDQPGKKKNAIVSEIIVAGAKKLEIRLDNDEEIT